MATSGFGIWEGFYGILFLVQTFGKGMLTCLLKSVTTRQCTSFHWINSSSLYIVDKRRWLSTPSTFSVFLNWSVMKLAFDWQSIREYVRTHWSPLELETQTGTIKRWPCPSCWPSMEQTLVHLAVASPSSGWTLISALEAPIQLTDALGVCISASLAFSLCKQVGCFCLHFL